MDKTNNTIKQNSNSTEQQLKGKKNDKIKLLYNKLKETN